MSHDSMSHPQDPRGHAEGRGHDSTDEAWVEDVQLSPEQQALQVQLSCLVDGELDEPAAARAMLLLEESSDARAFFDDVRTFARLHRDVHDPARLEARVAMFGAALFSADDFAAMTETIDLSHRLATIFYQLGKAYVLTAIEPEAFQQRVFERVVPIEATRSEGRGFVDGVMARGERVAGTGPATGHGAALDWRAARSLFNGRLEQIADPLEKGRRLLEQAVETDPSHEEARIYLAFVHAQEGRSIRAAEAYRGVFDTALERTNRGHAAMQLGRLFYLEGDHRAATRWWRWLTISGLADADPRFEGVRLNLGVVYATTGNLGRSVDYFRAMLDQHLHHHAGDAAGVARLFAGHRDLRELIDSRPGLTEMLVARCPELFRPSAAGGAA
jgi:tetratricopeptide (TPR) repeat protein